MCIVSDFIIEHVAYDPHEREIDSFEAICQRLGDRGLVASDLLYVAVEGKPFLEGDEPSGRMSTWGTPYLNILEGYQARAEGRSPRHFEFLLWVAHKPERQVPAIVAYDIDQLVPENNPPYSGEWWVHKDGSSVDEALQALVYLDMEEQVPASS
jgi:hypothetical protein